MFAHTSAEIHLSLTNVLSVVAAATCLEIDALLFKLVRSSFVGAAEDVAQFWTRFGVEIDVIVKECSLELTV